MSIQSLKKGYKLFRLDHFEQNKALYQRLVDKGQNPDVMIIACADSRVDPSIITQAAPGEVFMVRNVANIVPCFSPDGVHHGTAAALEFAVQHLKVQNIIVMGHAYCGGCKAMIDGADKDESQLKNTDFIGPWIRIAADTRDAVLEEFADASDDVKLRQMEYAGVKMSLKNLRSYPCIDKLVDRGDLSLHGWYFDLDQGKILALDEDGEFKPLSTD